MNRRTQLNLLLVASALVLSALVWWDRPASPSQPAPLLDLQRRQIGRIEIHPDGRRAGIVLKHTQDGWRMTQPVEARARSRRVDSLLAMADIAAVRRYPATELDPQQAGLTPPRAVIRFGDAPALAIGARTPIDGNRDTFYVRVKNTMALAPLPNAGLLDLDWPQWISPQLLPPAVELTALYLPELTLTRADTGGWRVTPESRDRGADAAQYTIDAWRRARAVQITEAGNTPATGRVKFVFADGHTRRLEVVQQQPQLLLRDPALGITYHLPARKAASLLHMRHPATTRSVTGDQPPPRERRLRDAMR